MVPQTAPRFLPKKIAGTGRVGPMPARKGFIRPLARRDGETGHNYSKPSFRMIEEAERVVSLINQGAGSQLTSS